MDDITRPHQSPTIEEIECLTRTDWPECFPALNTIEHECDILGNGMFLGTMLSAGEHSTT